MVATLFKDFVNHVTLFLTDVLLLRSEYVGEWEQSDNPASEHRALFPYCPFMRGEAVGNVPIVVGTDGGLSQPTGATLSRQNATSSLVEMADADHDETSFPSSSSSSSESTAREAEEGEDDTGIRHRDVNSRPERSKYILYRVLR